MLTKNVYIIYPAGYHGNYLKWAIESSDVDMLTSGEAPLNPINTSNSAQWGGVGTSHKSVRIPTHARLVVIRRWIIHNRPSIKKVYVINAGVDDITDQTMCDQIADLLIQDPTGIVIALHSNNDPDIKSYGIINAVTKWPTNVYVSTALGYNDEATGDYDPFNCADSQVFRNNVVENKITFGSCNAPSEDLIENSTNKNEIWFESRRKFQPHEMENGNYPRISGWRDRFFSMSCMDIVSPDLPEKLAMILSNTGISDNFDTSPLQQVHQGYIDIQPNLQWFKSVKLWEETGEIDDYIRSHSIIQAQILKRMIVAANIQELPFFAKTLFLYMYYTLGAEHWPRITSEQDFFSLPEFIQNELLDRGLKLSYTGPSWPEMASLNWRELSIDEINAVYQREKKLFNSSAG